MYVLPVLYSCRAVAVPLHSVSRACTFYPFLYLCRACTIAQSTRVMYVLPVLYSCRACTIAQSARVMYVLPVLYSCRAVAVPLHRVLYSHRALTYCTVSTGNVRFTRFVLVPCCGCTIVPCVGNVPFTRFLYSCRACTFAQCQHGSRTYWSSSYSCCGCTIARCVPCLYCDFFPFMLDIKFVEGFSYSSPRPWGRICVPTLHLFSTRWTFLFLFWGGKYKYIYIYI